MANACVAACAPSSIKPVLVKDRRCKVDLAVDREKAQKLKETVAINKDKRNLYLMNEGVVGEKDVPSEEDRDKRKRSQNERRKKLQNPLFFVSANRICIRNLRKDLTNSELHNMCVKVTTLSF